MMTRRKTSTKTQHVTAKEVSLTHLQEQVVRMRRGLKAPLDLTLEHKAGANTALKAKLDEIERRVLAAAGTRQNPTKRKIISALRSKRR